MSELVCLCIVLALIGAIFCILFLAHKERVRWQAERKDLYDRIQAGSVEAYQMIREEPQKPRVVNTALARKKAESEALKALIGKEGQE